MSRIKKIQQLFLITAICIGCILLSFFIGAKSYAETDLIPEENTKIPILMYHHLVESGEASGVTITEKRFREHMKYLNENGFTALLPIDLLLIKNNEMDMPKNPVMITFDDGYESNYKIAYPILKDNNMKATIFVIVKNMNKKVNGHVPKLTWDQMEEMYKSGYIDIQSHTYNLHNSDSDGEHVNLASNGIQRGLVESCAQYQFRLEEDAALSIKYIEKNVGNKVFCLAYPYGAFDPWCMEALERQGIIFGFMVENEMADLNDNLYCLKRFNIGMSSDLSKILIVNEDMYY
ncbi:polysaccharide deacetylase family protein [Anaerovorax odorimutans]|uniref:polysaccharide deacetylase family protein n=1 Tax=Anaerovorax odorimutans TaxID=109327 RepID=UPI00041A95B2|nr:polysaccharide deacetylase family protein [Anaerovorax odorimutans]